MLITLVISLAITLAGFIIGIINIMKKKAPFFFTLIIFGIGCYVVELLSFLVNVWCGFIDDVWVGTLGVFACNCFLLSANYGALDKILGETKFKGPKKMLALVIPAVLFIISIVIFVLWKDKNLLYAVIFAFLSAPAIPTAYFNVKHLLLPEDELGLLKAIRPCDIMSLIFFFVSILYLFAEIMAPLIFIEIAGVGIAVSLLGLSLAAVSGVRAWEI